MNPLNKKELTSPKKIVDYVYSDKPIAEVGSLDYLLDTPKLPSQFYKEIDQPDMITDKIYSKNEKGEYVYPLDKFNFFQVDVHSGSLGVQTNQNHKESVKQNTALILKRLSDKYKESSKRDKVLLVGFFMNAGKKYSARTSSEPKAISDDLHTIDGKLTGQITFPDYEKLSAYIAAKNFKMIGYTKEEAEPYVASIYHQKDLNKENKKSFFPFMNQKSVSFEEEFVKVYGDEFYELTLDLFEAKKGIGSYLELSEKQNEIAEGEKLIRKELDPYLISITDRSPITVKEINKKYYAVSQSDEFEEDTKKTLDELERRKQEELIRKKHLREYEEIIKSEQEMVEEQRQIESAFVSKAMDFTSVLAAATLKAKEDEIARAQLRGQGKKKSKEINEQQIQQEQHENHLLNLDLDV